MYFKYSYTRNLTSSSSESEYSESVARSLFTLLPWEESLSSSSDIFVFFFVGLVVTATVSVTSQQVLIFSNIDRRLGRIVTYNI